MLAVGQTRLASLGGITFIVATVICIVMPYLLM